ncbi:hypothetical protein D3C84_1122670 [compost metagenome]
MRHVVAGGQVQCPVVGLDAVEVDVAEENRVQCQKTIERQRACIEVRVGEAGFDTELAAAEEPAGFVIQVGHALRRLGILFERLAV